MSASLFVMLWAATISCLSNFFILRNCSHILVGKVVTNAFLFPLIQLMPIIVISVLRPIFIGRRLLHLQPSRFLCHAGTPLLSVPVNRPICEFILLTFFETCFY